jgi:hypothetical protein
MKEITEATLIRLADYVREFPRTARQVAKHMRCAKPTAYKMLQMLTGDPGKKYRIPGEQLTSTSCRDGGRGPLAKAYALRMNEANRERAISS